jgi:2-methylisocitrate lyase-like PEP mutase family enzyme
VLSNVRDAGSALILEQVGFPAIATTSAGIAWSCGVQDGGALDRDRMLEHVEAGADCVFVPGVVEEDTIRRLAARSSFPAPIPALRLRAHRPYSRRGSARHFS